MDVRIEVQGKASNLDLGASEKGFSKEVMLKLNLKKEVTHNSPLKIN